MADIAIIGGGNMGEALIKGLQGQKLFVCESNLDRVRYLKKKYKITAAGITDAVAASSIVSWLLSRKTWNMRLLK